MKHLTGALHVTVGHRATGSYPRHVYCTPPFNLANISQDRDDPAVYMMTMSSSPGILDGDDLDVRVIAEPGSRLMLKNQGYQRVFNMQRGARQKMELHLHAPSEISYIQQPVVPHKNAALYSRNTVRLEDDCVFTLGEIITCGRKLCGEVFRFRRLHSITEVWHRDRLILKDNILLEPALVDVQGIGQAEGYSHQATLVHVNTRSGDVGAAKALAESILDAEDGLACGISQPLPFLLVVRALANGGEPLYDAFQKIEASFWKLNEPAAVPGSDRAATPLQAIQQG
jgi:urease accessory protein